MKRKPPTPDPASTKRPPHADTGPSRLRRWARRRRHDAATHLLRGVCYGIGTGTIGLVFWWLEHHL